MNRIGFSHHYPKLHNQTSGRLLAVIPIKGSELNDALLEYDTFFHEEDGNKGYYPLPRSGSYLQLVFLGNLRIPFCTIRAAYPPSKFAFYSQHIGEVFEINYKPSDGGSK